MDIIAVVNQILMMLIIMGIGLLLRKIGIMGPDVIRGISGIVLKAAMPALLLMMVQKDVGADYRGDFLRIVIVSFIWFSAELLAVYHAVKKKLPAEQAPVFASLSAMPNVGYMGLPIVQAVYGNVGALYLGAVVAAFNVCAYLFLEMLMTGKPPKPSFFFKNIGLVLAVLGIVMLMLNIKLPMPFSAVVTQLGALTTPLSMLVAGARLLDFKPSALRDNKLWVSLAVRLLISPVVAFAAFRLLGFEGIALGVLTIACAMPGAVVSLMYAEREKKDALFAATGISVGTLLCLVTIPLVLLLTGLGG